MQRQNRMTPRTTAIQVRRRRLPGTTRLSVDRLEFLNRRDRFEGEFGDDVFARCGGPDV